MVPIYLITNPQFLVYYDGRWIGRNVLDNATAATIAQLDDPTTPGGAVLQQLIGEASEKVMAACAVGQRYQLSDLQQYGGFLLQRLVADLAMGSVLKRRGRAVTDQDALNASYTEALDYLEQLRRGERIFWQVPAVAQSGAPEPAPMQGIYSQGPQLSQIAFRYFGIPAAGNGLYPNANPYGLNPPNTNPNTDM